MNHPIMESLALVGRVRQEEGTEPLPPDGELTDPWYWNTLRQRSRAWSVVNEWHRDHHPGRLDHCDQQPCHAVVMAVFEA